MNDSNDKRLHQRVDANLVVRSRILDLSELPLLASALGKNDPDIPALNVVKSGSRVSQFTSVNMSLGGISASGDLTLDSEEPYSQGADIVVEFDLLDGQPPVRAVAQVMWVKPDGERHHLGLMFLLIGDASYERIQTFVKKHLK